LAARLLDEVERTEDAGRSVCLLEIMLLPAWCRSDVGCPGRLAEGRG